MDISACSEDKVKKAIARVISESSYDFNNWWSYDFVSDVFVSSKADYEELSQNDLEMLRFDWIYSVVDDFVASACKVLNINTCDSARSKDIEIVWEITREMLYNRISHLT